MSWRAAAVLAVSGTVACNADRETPLSSLDPAAEECDWLAAPEPADADEPICDLEFREITRLRDVDSITPHRPVMVLRDGRYVTATYWPGKVALWSPDGVLADMIGRGAGEGPGEFDFASGLVEVAEGELLILTGSPIVQQYTTRGRFLRSFRLPSQGAAGSAVAHGGTTIMTVPIPVGWQGLLLSGDGLREFGLRGRRESTLFVAAAEDVGVWSAESDRYVLRRHAFPGGAVVDSLVVVRDWLPGPSGNPGGLYGLHADGRGLIWTTASARDPDAPSDNWLPTEEEAIEDLEAFVADTHRFQDTVIEAFAPDGRLVVSARFDSYWEAGRPMHGNIWYRETEDGLAIIVLEAVLTER